ncbi:hypothetical protein JTB14_014127 [Gonioctena quinquepunctata]|nr:hypothetical protein JTB14_014127 [Gonioctena quinquepunctata]
MCLKSWLLKRNKFGHDRLVTELRLTSAADYRNYLRMDAATFSELLEMVTPLIQKITTNMREAISPELRLLATMRYLVSGAQTLERIIVETCDALVHVLKGYLEIPASEGEWKDVAQQFERRWNFPNCIGAIDGKHINIRKPPGSGSYYFNYKNSFSVVLMAVVNANCEFIVVDMGANGRVSDEGGGCSPIQNFISDSLVTNFIFLSLMIYQTVKSNSHTFSWQMMHFLSMKPFSRKNLTREQAIFDHRLSRARRIVENAFGILASRFRILLREINLGPEKASLIVLACTHLHNCLRMKIEDSYNRGGFDVENTTGEIVNADSK